MVGERRARLEAAPFAFGPSDIMQCNTENVGLTSTNFPAVKRPDRRLEFGCERHAKFKAGTSAQAKRYWQMRN